MVEIIVESSGNFLFQNKYQQKSWYAEILRNLYKHLAIPKRNGSIQRAVNWNMERIIKINPKGNQCWKIAKDWILTNNPDLNELEISFQVHF